MSAPIPGEEDPLGAYQPNLAAISDGGESARATTAEPTAAETIATSRVVVLTLAAVLGVKALDWLVLAKRWEADGRFNDADFQAAITKELERKLRRPLVPVLAGMLVLGHHTLAESIGFEAVAHPTVHAIAETWARHYVTKISRDYGVTSAEAIRPSVADWLTRPLPAAAMASRARDLYGLDPRAAAAVQSYSAKPGRKDSRGLIERYLETRVHANASVWTMAAHNAGRELLYAQAVADGMLPRSTRKVWVTQHDERVCPVCGPMDGVSVPLGGRYHVGGSLLMTPPVHPRCRCTIDINTHPSHRFVRRRHSGEAQVVEHFLASAVKTVFR